MDDADFASSAGLSASAGLSDARAVSVVLLPSTVTSVASRSRVTVGRRACDAPPELVPPELVPEELVPPALVSVELAPAELVPEELVPPALVPVELAPEGLPDLCLDFLRAMGSGPPGKISIGGRCYEI